MQRLSRLPFRSQVLIGCILAVVVTNVPLIVFQILNERSYQKRVLAETAQLTADNFAALVALPMWDFNEPFLQEMFDGLAAHETVATARLVDETGDLQAEFTRTGSREGTWADVDLTVPVIYGEADVPVRLGEVSIRFSGQPAARAVAEFARSRLMSFAVLVILATATLYLVLGKVLEPLGGLVASIRAIEGGRLDEPVADIDRDDEIGRVALALEHLRQVEKEVQRVRARQDTQKSRERHRMLLALKSTDDAVIVVDEDKRIVLQNPRAAEFFGPARRGEPIAALPELRALAGSGRDAGDSVHRIAKQDGTLALRVRKDTIRDDTGAVLGQVILASDITEQMRQQERADYLARHDGLTGLPNRRALELALGEIGDAPAALLLCDLDRFKQINDTMGHAVGDGLLRRVGDFLREVTDRDMLPVRLGGDEFAILARGRACRSRLEYVADAMLERLMAPVTIEERLVECGASLGLASMPDDAATPEALMQIADVALYRAKEEGRGRLCVVERNLLHAVTRRQHIERLLRDALAEGRGPVPVYQCQTDAVSRRITGFEALARWRLPDGTAISAEEFIRIAEEAGLIADITRRILRRACTVASRLRRRGFEGRIAVNVSPILFDGTIGKLVDDILVETGCTPDALEIEITEQVVLSEKRGAAEEIEALRRRGITLALDDFGMGFSSLSYLQRFPVDKIKIDRAFVSEVARSDETRAIIRAIVDLSVALGMKVTAEGAESEAEREILAACGVDTIQGWVDGRPLHRDRVLALDLTAPPPAHPADRRAG